jgi:ATP-binding cassette subfamily C protein LapB
MFFILRKIFADRALFFKLLVASLFVNLLALATPIYVIQVLQRYIAYGVISTLITLFFGIIFIVIFEFLFKNIRHRMARQYELGNVTYANQILNKLVSIKTQIYEVSKKFRNDIINHHLSNIQNTFSATNIISILDVPFTLIFLLALFLIHYQLGLITLFFLGLPFLVNRVLNERVHKLSQQSVLDNNNSFRLFENVLTRNSTIKYFNILKFISNSWNLIANRIANTRENLETEKNLVSSFSGLIASLLTVFIIGWGATLAVDGQISVGALIGANILAARALMPINRLVILQDQISRMEDSYSELNRFSSYASEKSEGREIQDLEGKIVLQDAFFQYPEQKNPIFESLNLTVSPGELAVIVGNNGSGKSTLIKSLAGILEFTRGRFLLDDIEVSQIAEKWYRRNLIYSPQEPKFVDGSIKDNLIGETKIEQDQFVKILTETNLISFINVDKNGVNKILDSSDDQLPLGIRKRMALARGMVNNGKTVYLDEPTEGLDSDGKKSVHNIIKNFKKEKKSLVIATNDQEIIDISDILVDLNSKPKPLVVKQKK